MSLALAKIEPVKREHAAAFLEELDDGGTAIVAGISGFGKTYILQRALEGSRRLVVINPYATIDRRRHSETFVPREQWRGDVWTHAELVRDPSPLFVNPMRVIYDPGTLDETLAGERMRKFLDLLWTVGNVDVVLEEAGLYSRHIIPLINRLCTGSARMGMRVYLITQSYSRLTLDARRNPIRMALFAQVDDLDYSELRAKIGNRGVEYLRRMQKREPAFCWKQGDLTDA